MRRNVLEHGSDRTRGTLEAALAVVSIIACAGPAVAGDAGGTLQAKTLVLELDSGVSQFRLDDGDATTDDPFQVIFDRKIIKNSLSCQLGLSPPETVGGQILGTDPAIYPPLVSFDGTSPAPGIDSSKFALGGRTNKGTGCGQLEFGQSLRLETPHLLLGGGRLQLEVKQDASARGEYVLDGETVAMRYLLSGTAPAAPPFEVTDACFASGIASCDPANTLIADCINACEATGLVTRIKGRADGGPDSGNQDDGFWPFSVPIHNVEVYNILENRNGVRGKISLKGGAEYEAPRTLEVRSTWTAFEAEGLLGCLDTDTEGANLLVRRLCDQGELIPYNLEYDTEARLVTFDVDTGGQEVQTTFDVCWKPQPADELHPTLLSFQVGVGPEDTNPQNGTPDCLEADPHPTCFEVGGCVGTPTYECFNADGSRPNPPVQGCVDPARCLEEDPADCVLCDTGQTCELVKLDPPSACEDEEPCTTNADCQDGSECKPRFPDRDEGLEGDNYGCWYKQDDLVTSEDTVGQCEGIFTNTDQRLFKR